MLRNLLLLNNLNRLDLIAIYHIVLLNIFFFFFLLNYYSLWLGMHLNCINLLFE
jgi:hypothetical protein